LTNEFDIKLYDEEEKLQRNGYLAPISKKKSINQNKIKNKIFQKKK
jgi:hypothetical protein